ncbi:hypothetical protein [Snuella lapsa]|uniref:Uncharacterized protein n=1 Tax=Snuella lapsa TaxID=870481 RepID=A0ABP6WWS4_9FLAO
MNFKKKIVTFIGAAAMATAMFFSVNTSNALKGDLDLASLLEVNMANAECTVTCPDGTSTTCTTFNDTCTIYLDDTYQTYVTCPNSTPE